MMISPIRLIFVALLIAVTVACGMWGGIGNPIDVALIRDGISARAASSFPTEAGLFLNYVGGAPATISMLVIGAAMLYLRGNRRAAAWFAGIVIVGRGLVEAIKLAVHRARPALDPHPVVTHSLSFPSAHAANSMIVFPALVLFFIRPAHRPVAMAVAVLASLVVGASRPLLGVHWPSDVVAGWAIGAAWLTLAWSIAERSVSDQLHHDIVGGHGPAIVKQ
jgi:membrane-associated phospholipid phosphatase